MELFDLHCDTIMRLQKENADFFCKNTMVSINELEKFKRYCQAIAVFVPDRFRGDEAEKFFIDKNEYFKHLMEVNKDHVEQVWTYEDIDRITKQGKLAAMLTIEGAACLNGKIENVKFLHDCGVKIMTLTWNGENELASGHDTQKGFTEFGRAAVKEMEKVGIIVDNSHLNDVCFWELCEFAEKPFIETHSNIRTACGHRRNVTEERFAEYVKRGGIIGLNLCDAFIVDDPKAEAANHDALFRHVDRMLELGGENVVCCGSDFDGASVHESLNTPVKFAGFADYMLSHGISETVVKKIMWENAADFMKKYMK